MSRLVQGHVALIRHGRTAWNAEGRFLGRRDLPLDAVGLEQAESLGMSFRGLFSTVVSSPLLRARQTAEVLGCSVEVDDGWVEMDQGELEGLDADSARRLWGPELRLWAEDPLSWRIPGGESPESVVIRARDAWTRIAHMEPPVAVVTHQLTLAFLAASLVGAPLREWRRWKLGNTEMLWLDGPPRRD